MSRTAQCSSYPSHVHVVGEKSIICFYAPTVTGRSYVLPTVPLSEPMSTGARWTANNGRLNLNPNAVRHFLLAKSSPIKGRDQVARMAAWRAV